MQVIGNPLDYPISDIVKKGSRFLINFLQENWKNEGSNCETMIQLKKEANTGGVQNTHKKVFHKNTSKNKKIVKKYFCKSIKNKLLAMRKIYYDTIFLDRYVKDATDGEI